MSLETLKPGQCAELQAEVTRDLTINRMGREGAEVLSTPSLLGLMEQCSIDATDANLPAGYATVGYAVDGMRHLAPTPIGHTVRVKAVLTAVDGNRLTYSIEAFEGDEKIGVAVHKRAVVSKDAGS
jgi:predicted thioesterase